MPSGPEGVALNEARRLAVNFARLPDVCRERSSLHAQAAKVDLTKSSKCGHRADTVVRSLETHSGHWD